MTKTDMKVDNVDNQGMKNYIEECFQSIVKQKNESFLDHFLATNQEYMLVPQIHATIEVNVSYFNVS